MVTDPTEFHGEQATALLSDLEALQYLMRSKWRVPIMLALQSGPKRLSHLRKDLPRASKKMLIENLQGLREKGLIVRKEYAGRVKHVEYSVNPVYGDRILSLLARIPNP